MNEPFLVRPPQTARNLNPRPEDLRFRQSLVLRHQVVETFVLDQFHHQIKLAMIRARGKDLHENAGRCIGGHCNIRPVVLS